MEAARGKVAVCLSGRADQKLVEGYLASLGHQVVTGFQPKGPLPDLFLLDIPYARRLGDKILARKKAAKDIFLPVLVAVARHDDIAAWLEAGFDDCLRMPFTKAELKARVGAFLRLRRQSAELARKSEYIYQTLVESSGDHIFMLDARGVFLSSNDRVARFGLKRGQELIGRSIEEVFPPESAALYRAQFRRVLSSGEAVVFEHASPTASGPHFHLDTLFPVDLPGGEKRVGGICRDISERVRAEEERRLLSTAIEHAAESVLITDRESRIIFVNAGFEAMSGYRREEVLGRKPSLLKSGQHDEAFYRQLHTTIRAGKVWKGHLTNRKKDGSLYEIEATIAPILDRQGEITHFVSVRRDVTKERVLERHLRQAQRLEAIGTLAGGIAHDFNNILSPIIGFTELNLELAPPGSKLRDNLEQVLLAAGRARDLVKQILSFSRQPEQEYRPVNMVRVVKEALKLLRAALPASIEIKQDIQEVPYAIMADPTSIHQVVMNLCTNAQHAMSEKGGILSIALHTVEVDPVFARFHPNLKPGTHLKLSVSDTGCGMPPEIMERIFEPYFTTKDEERGTGLGLAVVHGIVSSCGGAVTVYSEPGEGSTFNVYFPAIPVGEEAEPAPESPARGGHERILFVDDEAAIAQLGKAALERMGYQVWSYTDPVEALEHLRRDPAAFDLVISDMTMPRLTGEDLAREVRKLRPDLPLILCSGFNDKIDSARAEDLAVARFLMKPVGSAKLAQAVRELLDQKAAPGDGPAGRGPGAGGAL